jgi:micrococcal nuclease
MNQQKTITILLIVIFTASVLKTGTELTQTSNTVEQENFTATTTKVIDGDTIDIQKPNGATDTVRILGIDTPETHGKNKPREYYLQNTSKNRRCLQKIGEKATQLVKNQTTNQKITVKTDPKADKRGTYGRLLAYIQKNQTTVGEKLLQKGYARLYNSTFTKKPSYTQLQKKARTNNKGIWNPKCGTK